MLVKVNRNHFFLEKILVVLVVLTRLDDIFQRFGAEDNADAAPCCVCGLDDERTSEKCQFSKRQLNFLSLAVWGNDDRVGNVNAAGQEFQMHRGLVRCPSEQIVGVDDVKGFVLARDASDPAYHLFQREEPFVFIGSAVKENADRKGIIMKSGDRFCKIALVDKKRRESAGSGCQINAAEELAIEIPVPFNSDINQLTGCFHLRER